MKSLVDHLAQYADYHRDRRNIATHFVGIPMIVVGIEGLLARAAVHVDGMQISVALVATVLAIAFYVALDVRFGVLMAVLFGASLAAGTAMAALSLGGWLAFALGSFVVGWFVQFVGHVFEGKKPAFVDDLVGLLIGPLFVAAEVVFALGLRHEVHDEIVRRAGPTRVGRAVSAQPASRTAA